MAGAGKSTVGSALAQELGWAFVDSDHLIEAAYGARLQDITDTLGKAAFLDTEGKVICAIKANRTVIATGGSVIYRDAAMQPGGSALDVRLFAEGGLDMAGIDGPVSLVARGKVWLPDPDAHTGLSQTLASSLSPNLS